MDATFEGDLLDHRAEGHDVVGNRQRIGIPQIDLILAGTRLVMRVFDRDAHLLEHVDGGAAEIHAWAARHMVEIAALIDRHRGLGPVVLLLEQVELDFGMHVEREALLLGLRQRALEHMAWVGERRLSLRSEHVAEHTRRALWTSAPRQNLEGARIGLDDHVVFGHTRHALDRGAIETNALLECGLQLCRRDGH